VKEWFAQFIGASTLQGTKGKMVNIRKANKRDLKEYLKLKEKSLDEYSKLIEEKIKFVKRYIIKEFNNAISKKNEVLLLIEENNKPKGYLLGVLAITPYYKDAYMGDLFIYRNDRKKGYATALIKKFIDICSKKSIKKYRLGVNIKNKDALRLYKKLGFKIIRYEMEKKK